MLDSLPLLFTKNKSYKNWKDPVAADGLDPKWYRGISCCKVLVKYPDIYYYKTYWRYMFDSSLFFVIIFFSYISCLNWFKHGQNDVSQKRIRNVDYDINYDVMALASLN